jgi:hypothetical protein
MQNPILSRHPSADGMDLGGCAWVRVGVGLPQPQVRAAPLGFTAARPNNQQRRKKRARANGRPERPEGHERVAPKLPAGDRTHVLPAERTCNYAFLVAAHRESLRTGGGGALAILGELLDLPPPAP